MKNVPASYHSSLEKQLLDYSVSILGLCVAIPLFIPIAIAIRLTSKGPVFFIQNRIGKNAEVFKIIKFRTMVANAEKLKKKFKNLNHADGPVFKIRNDPRLTKFGKLLVKTGLDELPQLINVIKGDMSIVGPRPFPVHEAMKLTKSQKLRELVKPGITSSWVTAGAHNLKFSKWMRLDREYVENSNIITDLSIMYFTIAMIAKLVARKIFRSFTL